MEEILYKILKQHYAQKEEKIMEEYIRKERRTIKTEKYNETII